MPNQFTGKDWSKVEWEKLGKVPRRQRLLEEAQFKCSRCGWNETRDNGVCPLEIDHIDGNHKNNSKDNLRVLCPNCHALTPNFRNWGRKGRTKSSGRLRKGNIGYEQQYTLTDVPVPQ